ncbi:hypothetical protein C8A05DRAFT_31251 [Staphylotrichum tortipilum]|uniref:Uncharacterized protein n=1 Tax=Staphylotrichum tortipilum TaxID=2831512 RepID=A0AAN6MSI9_9PEZI|nr:hypothetical protein C8A05DRAFT_31251 [Staphylotrichum longicolle]
MENRKQSSASTTESNASPTAPQFPAMMTTTMSQPPAAAMPVMPAVTTAVAGPASPPATPMSPTLQADRRSSDEWDAAKVPPSRFQKRKGSIYAVQSSRDGRVDNNHATKFYEKLAEMAHDNRGFFLKSDMTK